MTNACILKYILHGGDIDAKNYVALYFKTMGTGSFLGVKAAEA
jgi:hypothetical protein